MKGVDDAKLGEMGILHNEIVGLIDATNLNPYEVIFILKKILNDVVSAAIKDVNMRSIDDLDKAIKSLEDSVNKVRGVANGGMEKIGLS